ncbi:IDEAL domain-containing protein [Cohnella cellulosilytica]|uniref:IDEAL domain-containing protein n=1 Tax=Cohnella cellulosilytica TaxID=986710 RepID=A0ABW2F630_9BACL
MKFEIGDWVQAKTRNGEFVHGFIESIDQAQGMAKVFVVRSDNEQSAGKTTTVLEHWLRELPAYAPEEEDSLYSLIDLALATRDEAWFMELTRSLPASSGRERQSGGLSYRRRTPVNRLGHTARS